MTEMKFSRTLHITVALMCLIAFSQSICPTKTVLHIDEDFEKTCVPCPSNCSICYLALNKQPLCAFCEEGYFMDKEHKCRPCTENCSNCTEGDLNHCRSTQSGFFFDQKTQKIAKCNEESCQSCNAADFCVSCKEGYFAANKAVAENGIEKVVCQPCDIDNCLYCGQKSDQVKDSSFLTCTLCKSGYGIVGGKCEKCPDNCLYCHEESKECSFCETGYLLKKETNTCEKISIDNCYTLNDAGDCMFCESHFYLKDGKCAPCKKGIANCNYCTTKADSLTCLSCEIGYFIAGDYCKPCPENCNHCNSEKCFVCANGSYYNQQSNSCEKCTIDKCDVCRSVDVCDTCISGYYFDAKSKKCEP